MPPELPRGVKGEDLWYDNQSGMLIVNQTSIPRDAVFAAFIDQHPELQSIQHWAANIARRSGSLWQRDRYVTPDNIFDQFRTAYDAAHSDDVIAGSLEIGENLTFGWIDIEAEDEDDANIFNQISEQIDLRNRMRAIWRDVSITSNAVIAAMWGRRSYKVQGRSKDGVKRKKTYENLLVPIGISVLDPLKIVPVGNFLFGQEQLAYIAEPGEAESFDRVLAGDNTTDPLVRQIVTTRYQPDMHERTMLENLGVDVRNLFTLNPEFTWRLTATRAEYERWAPVRMKSLFEWLDTKHQLRESDRSALVGATNFIVLITIGSDKRPGQPAELAGMRNQVTVGARIPVIIGDERLKIEIITPKLDQTLKPERYNAIDARLAARILGITEIGNYSAGAKGDDSIKIAKVVARGLESRRADLIESMHKRLLKPVLDRNEAMTSSFVRIQFHPKRIAIDLDPNLMLLLQNLRDRGDLSRESILDEAGYDQMDEARKREREAELYDKTFTPTNVPFDSPTKTSGGNSNGGGANPRGNAPNTPTGKAPKAGGKTT